MLYGKMEPRFGIRACIGMPGAILKDMGHNFGELRKVNFSPSSGTFRPIRDRRWKAKDVLFPASIGSWGRFPAALILGAVFSNFQDFSDFPWSRWAFCETAPLFFKIKHLLDH